MANEHIFEAITDFAVNEHLTETLLENQSYQEVQSQIGRQIELFDKLNLDKEQWLIIDRLVSLHTDSGALYGRIAYQQGYRDCVALLQTMNLIKAS